MYQSNGINSTEARLLARLEDPDVAFYRQPRSKNERYATPPTFIAFERINGGVVARVRNPSTGRNVLIGLDSFGNLVPRHVFG